MPKPTGGRTACTDISGTALYVAAVVRTLVVYEPQPFRVTVDGVPNEMEAWLVAVGNGPAYAGGMHITPNASMHDGLLDVTVIGAVSKPQLIWSFPRVFKGSHVTHPATSTFRGEHIEVEALDPTQAMDVYADGERVGPLPATMDAVRNALTVRIPASAERAQGSGSSGLGLGLGFFGGIGLGRFPSRVPRLRHPRRLRHRRRVAPRRPLPPASSVTVSPVTLIAPCMPASRWPGSCSRRRTRLPRRRTRWPAV